MPYNCHLLAIQLQYFYLSKQYKSHIHKIFKIACIQACTRLVQYTCIREVSVKMNVSIKDFAKKHNISYEAVRQQIKRYQDDLKGHIHIEGKTKFIDEYAQEFLENKRKINPVIVYDVEKDELIEQLKAEKEALLLQLLEKSNEIDKLKNEKINYIEQKLSLEYKEKELKQVENKLVQVEKENEELKKELSQEKNKSFFRRLLGK